MKTIINKFVLFVMLFAGAASLHGCSDPDGIIEDIAYGREFSPLNFTHTLANNVNVTFSWTVMTGIADYTLTLSYADGEGGVYDQVDLIAPLDGDGNTVKTMEYSFRELPGNREWIAELVAVSQRAGVADSKPATCAFATGVENLFLNDGKMGDGDVTAHTKAGELSVTVQGGTVWMDMAKPRLLRELGEDEWDAFYEAYGLTTADRPEGLTPAIVSTGLADVMLPVWDHDTLMRAVQNEAAVTALSKKYDVTGVHMFCLGDGCTAYCSNYAPLYDIPEECATGTSNGALTYYLYLRGIVQPGQENVFLQGEHMNRPSEIRSRLYEQDGAVNVRVGGSAVMSMQCEVKI